MRVLITVLACAAALAHAPVSAGVITVPVSGMQGDFFDSEGGIERSAAFTFVPQITSITEVRVKLTGMHTGGGGICNGLPWSLDFLFVVEIYDSIPGTGHTRSMWTDQEGAFVETMRVGMIGVTDWSFLLDGSANIRITGDPSRGCIIVGPPPEGSLATVEIQIYGDVTTPVETTSWGSIKALYR